MIYIKADGSDYNFFKELENTYSDVIVSSSKNFDGSAELIEVFITLSPALLSALTVIITQILSYMKSKHNDNANKTTEIQLEKKQADDEFKIIIKSSDIDDLNETIEKVISQIKM